MITFTRLLGLVMALGLFISQASAQIVVIFDPFTSSGLTTSKANSGTGCVPTTTANVIVGDGAGGCTASSIVPNTVVTGITNDTNVTGSISTNVLTLGWTGTLAAARLVNAGVHTGDAVGTFPAVTVQKVNGIAYSATAAAHSIQVTTTANTTVTAKVLPDCTDTGGNHLNFTQSTDAFSCGTSGSGGISSITGDGSLISNSASTGAVTLTLGTAAAHKYWGNATGSTTTPSYSSIVAADLPATAVTPGSYTNSNITVDQQGRITAATNGSGGGTGCVPGGSNTDILVSDGAGACTATGVTIDGSNNISTAGGISTGVGGSVAGYSAYAQGTATTAPTSSVGFMAPASVTTKFMMKLPAAPTAGFIFNTGTTDPTTLSFIGISGTGSVCMTTNCLMTTPTGDTITATTGFITGADNSSAGSVQIANGSANAHTIFQSGATTTNTIKGFATVPTTGRLLDCTVTSTTCLLHDSGITTANVVNASSPGAGIAHFAGSTQNVTSSAVSLTADITGVLPTANIAVALANQTSIHGITAGTAAGDATLGQVIAHGATALDFASTATGACATLITATATGAVSTDTIIFNANASIKAVTGYVPASTGGFSIAAFPTTNTVSFEGCNWTAGTVDPSSITVNWIVVR